MYCFPTKTCGSHEAHVWLMYMMRKCLEKSLFQKSSASITSLQQGRSGRLSPRSSRSITSLQQGRSGRLSARSSRSITSPQQGRSRILSARSSRSITCPQQGGWQTQPRIFTKHRLSTARWLADLAQDPLEARCMQKIKTWFLMQHFLKTNMS